MLAVGPAFLTPVLQPTILFTCTGANLRGCGLQIPGRAAEPVRGRRAVRFNERPVLPKTAAPTARIGRHAGEIAGDADRPTSLPSTRSAASFDGYCAFERENADADAAFLEHVWNAFVGRL